MAREKRGRRPNKTGQIIKGGKKFTARLKVGVNARTGQPQFKTARCDTPALAADALQKMIDDRVQGAEAPVDRSNFGQFLDDWLATVIKPTKSHNTYRQCEWICRTHIKPHLGM